MVTATGTFGSLSAPISYKAAEPPGVTEVRSAFENLLTDVYIQFVNASVQATAIGFKALDEGDYITLDDLEDLIHNG